MAATPARLLPPVLGLGLGTGLQLLPSQCIVRLCGPLLPTAQTSLGETAAMAQSSPAPCTSTTDQARPSQCITRGFGCPPEASSREPAAHTSSGEMATTPLRVPPRPARGVGAPLQSCPFQRMMSGCDPTPWLPVEYSPTAHTSPEGRAAAALRMLI